MSDSTRNLDQFDIADVELGTLYMFCREPSAVFFFPAPASDILNPVTRLIVEAAQDLKNRPKAIEATVEILSAHTGLAVDDLRRYGRMVTAQIRKDWKHYPKLIKLAAQKRRVGDALVEAQEELLYTSLFDTPRFYDRLRVKLARLAVDAADDQTVEISDILREMTSGELKYFDPLPTGIDSIDTLLHGGVRPNEIFILGGAMKQGKTTGSRNIMYNMNDFNRIHIAADGGTKYKHTCYYIGMRAKAYCIDNDNTPTIVHGYVGDCLHPTNLSIWISNQTPGREQRQLLIPLPPQVEQCVRQAYSDFLTMEARGQFLVVDPKKIGFSIQNLLNFIESAYYQNDAQVVMIDHAGKFGDKARLKIYDRLEMNAQLLVDLFNRLEMAAIILSQRNAEGIKKHNHGVKDEDEDEDYSAHLEGGTTWEKEADYIFTIRRPRGRAELKIRAHHIRDNESNFPTSTVSIHGATGLILPSHYQALDGY